MKHIRTNACHFQQCSRIDGNNYGEEDKKEEPRAAHTQNATLKLKMNPFTSACLLCTFGWRGRKRKRQFRGHSFSPFSSSALKTGLANALAVPRRSRKKEKHSNICRRFQTDSWDVNNSTLSLPWPLENKGEMSSRGAGSPRSGTGEQDLLSPLRVKAMPSGHPAPHTTATVIAAAQRCAIPEERRRSET